MTKGLNNSSENPDNDFGLPRAEILRGQKNFHRLFEGDVVLFRTGAITIRFCLFSEADNECLMAFIVGKKLGNAVKRNRVKRLLKEAYRLNKHILSDSIAAGSFGLHGALMANDIAISFEQAEQNIAELLHKVQTHILSLTDSDS